MKHTKLPWEIWPNSKSGQICISHHENHSNLQRAICEVHHADEANAAFIVRACNSHYELVEALEAIMPERIGYGNSMHIDMYLNAVAKARVALAKAKGEA